MREHSTYYIDLITKYLSGEASQEEMDSIAVWLKENPANREEFTKMVNLNTMLRMGNIENPDVTETEWNKLKSRIHRTGLDRSLEHDNNRRSAWFLRGHHTGQNWFIRAAAIAIILLIPAMFFWYFSRDPQMINYTASAQAEEIMLPDSSRVTLNKGATIRYPEHFKSSARVVEISGEAWFEVQHNHSQPFIVNAGKLSIEVLGTSFSVSEQADSQQKEVFLAEGKVKLGFLDQKMNSEVLSPGQIATVSESSHKILKTTNTDPNVIAWKTHHIIFDNTALQDALNTISKVYKINIKILQIPLQGKNITATFDQQSPESIFNVLEATLDLQIRKNNDTWEVTGKQIR